MMIIVVVVIVSMVMRPVALGAILMMIVSIITTPSELLAKTPLVAQAAFRPPLERHSQSTLSQARVPPASSSFSALSTAPEPSVRGARPSVISRHPWLQLPC